MKRVLIIDDDVKEQEKSIRDGFRDKDTEVILCSTAEEGLAWIRSKALFDCIVLDWYLEDPESSLLSKLILTELNKNYFAPVMIYSNQSADFKLEIDAKNVSYPDNLIHEVEKNDPAEICGKIEEWLSGNYTARLSSIYLQEVYDKIHTTFWKLNEIDAGNIAAVYKIIVSEKDNIDWSNDFIINLLLQGITSDSVFREKIAPIIQQASSAILQTSVEERRRILNKILYYESSPVFLGNGDIICISAGNQSLFAFVATPDCDLAQGNTRYVDIIELTEFKKVILGNTDSNIEENKSSNHFYLPAVKVADELIDLVAVFKANHILNCKTADSVEASKGIKYPAVANRIKYADAFAFNNSECEVKHLCSLVNPYKAEFLQKRNSHNSRVGIPGIYQYLKGN